MLLSLEEKIGFLRNLDFLADQCQEVYSNLAEIVNTIEVKSGDSIFSKGDEGGAIYIVAKGCVQIHDEGHVFTELEIGSTFGEYALIKREDRSASASAKVDTILIECTQEHLEQIENKFSLKIIDSILIPLQNMRKRMVVKDLLEEELTRQKAMVEKQRIELEHLNATKDKFFSIIAHDLKNPFASLIGASDLLVNNADEFSADQVKTFSGIINKSAKQAHRLLENLLDWSRTQTGSIKWKPVELDLWNLVSEVVILLTSSAENKDISLVTKVEENLMVFADENMLNTVVRNLISNAIKFTPQGGEIEVNSVRKGNSVEIEVKDNGVGIAKENINKLFRIDEQLVRNGTENETGTGLGLILCKEFVEKHKGKIWVESTLGVGSSFKFSLPVLSKSK
jgi:signal transduction histidine kinase